LHICHPCYPSTIFALLQELDNKGYICPQCNNSYPALDVLEIMDPARGAFICEVCHAELVDNRNMESVKGSQDRMERFNKQMLPITKGLQKSESMVIPACVIDPPHIRLLSSFSAILTVSTSGCGLRISQPTATGQKSSQAGAGLKVAGSGPARKEDSGISVMMSMDKDESTRKLKREEEAALKRQQNAVPAWHLKSTISGDLTALGIQEHARAETSDAAISGVSSTQ
jgi:transcription initiation factor TFIIE subunit alpha